MSALFGPSGNSERFYREGYKKTQEAFAWLKHLGLDAFEYPAGNGITASLTTFASLGNEAKKHGIKTSFHAPYFISLSSTEKQKRDNSINYICDDMSLNQSECRVYIKGEPVKMTTKEYQLLLLLMKNPRRALSRDTILDKIWGFEYDGNDRTIDTHIKMLRHSIGDYSDRIRTVRGVGYSFEGEVKVI